MKKAALISGLLIMFFTIPLFSFAQSDRIVSKTLKIEEVQPWLHKILIERGDEKNAYELVKVLGIYQAGNTATIYYAYAVTDRPTGYRKIQKVATLYVIRFNSGEWFSPKGFTKGTFLTK